MNLDPIDNLPLGSRKRIIIECDFKASDKCRNIWSLEYRQMITFRQNNNGKDICLFCSRFTKFSGRNNPNCKYIFDDHLFSSIDSYFKSYLLGWIASDGTINNGTICIEIHIKDREILEQIVKSLNISIPVHDDEIRKRSRICINSKTAVNDVCRWLNIKPGKKSHTVGFPHLIPDEFKWAFIAGLFDGDGSIARITDARKSPLCNIKSSSTDMRSGVIGFTNISCKENVKHYSISWSGVNALNFMSKIYQDTPISLSRKRELYFAWNKLNNF